ncbi:BON domain-containing protein [Psychrobacter sp. CCUG 69069]|jgi:osmotically-inducible protein OsmY|uniref:BON domain-containing protein n=1 Tax=Psychrobacter namhaensis TaxID=292734 RepID=A0ABW8L932_9GAMM|nr:BON domain-containing protein [Psychrobacter sp. CCUG 69069]MCD1279431.1 BON domain-containing protein [Psychrobacter sp. CCUG 69069]|tara:strand:+ start:493 stop:1329 length:837 start_codon:yes stop_codon:yes gene_type:complete
MTRLHLRTAIFGSSRRTAIGVMLMASVVSTGCTTNYLTNSTEGTYGVPMTERTIPQRLLDRSIEHTAKINIYGLREDLQQTSRMGIDSFNSEVLLTGEVPTEAIKAEVEKVVNSMPDVRRVYNELEVSASKGYSSTVHDGYITSKLLAKVATSDGVKASQIKAVTNNGVVYIMGRMTPTQQSYLIDIANSTVGVTELVLLTTVVDDRGVKIGEDDIMYENNLARPAAVPVVEGGAVSSANNVPTSDVTSTATPIILTEEEATVDQSSSSPYIDLYQGQ